MTMTWQLFRPRVRKQQKSREKHKGHAIWPNTLEHRPPNLGSAFPVHFVFCRLRLYSILYIVEKFDLLVYYGFPRHSSWNSEAGHPRRFADPTAKYEKKN